MVDKPDYRDLIVDCPACRATVQAEHLDGATYTEFEPLLRSIRRGSIIRVYRPFLLGGAKGRTDRQRRVWAERSRLSNCAALSGFAARRGAIGDSPIKGSQASPGLYLVCA